MNKEFSKMSFVNIGSCKLATLFRDAADYHR